MLATYTWTFQQKPSTQRQLIQRKKKSFSIWINSDLDLHPTGPTCNPKLGLHICSCHTQCQYNNSIQTQVCHFYNFSYIDLHLIRHTIQASQTFMPAHYIKSFIKIDQSKLKLLTENHLFVSVTSNERAQEQWVV